MSTVSQSNSFMKAAIAPEVPAETFPYYSGSAALLMLALAFPLNKSKWRDILISYVVGAMFCAGLAISGMTQRSKVVQFLNISPAWDPSLAFVLGTGVMFLIFVFLLIPKQRSHPLLDSKGACKDYEDCYTFLVPRSKAITLPLVVGAWLFGMGWGLAGLCPGPAIIMFSLGHPKALVFMAAMLVGMSLGMGVMQGLDRLSTKMAADKTHTIAKSASLSSGSSSHSGAQPLNAREVQVRTHSTDAEGKPTHIPS